MDRVVPLWAAVGLCLNGCKGEEDVSIVGRWDATQIGDQKYPWDMGQYDSGATYTITVFLRIEEDLSGTYTERETVKYYDATVARYDTELALTVDDEMAPQFTIKIPERDLTLQCTVDGAKLGCTDQDEVAYSFKKL